ncbi:hypothetical protein XC29_18145 [Clostridioides difficile]|uniref:hypothetical protein n=1 Tax=Clostridioides difficile TaxID=1496 RepID=UPI0028A3F073|nr:hypothetical protein [Clostridioides difficile]KAK2237335.1 hypothetical protein XC29_18145 [Clostridioides difficile]
MIIIRSQDKLGLMRTDRVEIGFNRMYAILENENRKIAEYESKERAIQVLNEIQEFIENGVKMDYIDSCRVRHNQEKIFEMPVE